MGLCNQLCSLTHQLTGSVGAFTVWSVTPCKSPSSFRPLVTSPQGITLRKNSTNIPKLKHILQLLLTQWPCAHEIFLSSICPLFNLQAPTQNLKENTFLFYVGKDYLIKLPKIILLIVCLTVCRINVKN